MELRPWSAAELPALEAALTRSRGHLARWVPVPAGDLDGPAFLARCGAPDHVARGIWSPTGTLLGGCELRRVGDDSADLGLWIGVEHAGRGLGAAALLALCALAFGQLGLRRLTWQCSAEHTASRRLAERCGFVLEGTLREAHRRRDDDGWEDRAVYGRLWHDPPAPTR